MLTLPTLIASLLKVSAIPTPWLMFNLNEDPYELVNLAHNTRWGSKRRELQERLAQWVLDTQDVFELPAL